MSDEMTHIPYYQTDHGVELYARALRFTAKEKAWRKSTVELLMNRLGSQPEDAVRLSATIRGVAEGSDSDGWLRGRENRRRLRRKLREEVTEILLTLRVVNEILKVWFGSPDWGNRQHLINELVFILLTRRSKIEDAIEHLASIQKAFVNWSAVADADPDALKAVIMGGGLEDYKVESIQGTLNAIRGRFGGIEEKDLARMTDDDLDSFLQTLPGVGPKSSACVLMYARDADVFPADTHCIRTLTRLGVFASIGFSWSQQDHKKAERELRLLVPPDMRGDLHRNLVALGRQFCNPEKPQCCDCELRKFCRYYRSEQQKARSPETPTAIDVFSGAGGFSLGLTQSGFDMVAAIDSDPDATRTYRLNHPGMEEAAIIEGDAREVDTRKLVELLGGRRLDVLAGGPPCQGFSLVGNRVPHKAEDGQGQFGADYRVEEDERNHLFETMISFARALKPRYVVIENVPGLGSAEIREKSFAEFIAERLESVEYLVEVLKLEAADFGIPQKRHRYFILGVRYGEAVPDVETLIRRVPEEPEISLKHALFDLPPLDVADGRWIAAHNRPQSLDETLFEPYLGRCDIRGNTRILFNHVSRYNNEDDVTLYSHLRQGETYSQLVKRLTEEMGEHPSFARYDTTAFQDKYFRLEWDGHSKTIVSHLRKDGNSFVHPHQNRSLSVREAARIQSFPDSYVFCGSRGPQFVQIGNAVPPVMARAIGATLIAAMREATTMQRAAKSARGKRDNPVERSRLTCG